MCVYTVDRFNEINNKLLYIFVPGPFLVVPFFKSQAVKII